MNTGRLILILYPNFLYGVANNENEEGNTEALTIFATIDFIN
jgi:hypothetical protein